MSLRFKNTDLIYLVKFMSKEQKEFMLEEIQKSLTTYELIGFNQEWEDQNG